MFHQLDESQFISPKIQVSQLRTLAVMKRPARCIQLRTWIERILWPNKTSPDMIH